MKAQLLAVIVLLAACSGRNEIFYQEENGISFNDTYTFNVEDRKYIKIDSLTSYSDIICNCYTGENNEDKLTIYNSWIGRLYLYDYASGIQEKVIQLHSEGPNAISSGDFTATLPLVLNEDSIFIFGMHNNKKMSFVNGKGEKTREFSWDGPNYFFDWTGNAMLMAFKGKILINGLIGENEQISYNLFELDIENLDTKIRLPSPKYADELCWGLQYFSFSCNSAHNSLNNTFIHSFGSDHHLYITNTQFEIIDKHFVGSKYFKNFIPYSFKKSDCLDKYDDRKSHSLNSPKYFKLLHDPYRDFYYREVLLPRTEEGLRNNSPRNKSIIIIDNRFNKVGEYLLPKNTYNTSCYFITKEGLHLLNTSFNKNQEDSLQFDIIVPVKIKQ
ncbi:MAG TPA: DUF4221 family protein [Cyclobacteriaceae bacterium]|nr:DUF4221 family protein [Cyclobacteriaceae bacterium]